ncbi:MAG: hypothetical protein JW956_09375 [Calditrichaceae bacterium]|nr:hypothetical protein [Calditrichaceae bacterium]
MKIIQCAVLFFFVLSHQANSQTIVNFLNSNSRAMAMSGAFTSVYDIDNSPLWNPSISILEKDRKLGVESDYSHLELDLIPAGMAIGILALDNFFGDSTEFNSAFWKVVGIFAAYSIRGYTYSKDKFQFYLKVNEDLFDYNMLNTKNFFDNSQSLLAFSYQLGREFAVGTSLNYYQTYSKDDDRKKGFGNSIGLSYNALSLNQLSYGITYFNFPNDMKNVREKTERLIDNSINLGISYHYNSDYLVSLDIRDINHPDNNTFLETHLGLEERAYNTKNGKISFRQGGYFLHNAARQPVYSFGLGYRSNLDEDVESMYNINFGIIINRFIEKKYNLFFSTQINI